MSYHSGALFHSIVHTVMSSILLRWVAALTFLSAISISSSSAQQSMLPSEKESYAARVPGVVYVQFREGYSPFGVAKKSSSLRESDPVKKLFAEIGVTSVEPFDANAWKDSLSHAFGIDRMYVVNYSSAENPLSVVLRLQQTGLVATASPRYIFKLQYIPNDGQYHDQYYMQKIHAEGAWDITRGDSNVLIADIDAGVNYNHEDLKGNIKINPGESGNGKENNKKDDDGDGYIDDWRGWDAAGDVTGGSLKPDNDPYPSKNATGIANEATHGTMTSGCFGAVADNSLGISGVAPLCKIVPVKIGNDYEQLTGAYEGIYYASNMIAKLGSHGVLNNSWGGRSDAEALPFGQVFQSLITARGQVCVASAGNYHLNNDVTPFYPACVPGVLSVGATDQANKPSSFTHWGKSVLIYAPGVGIRTTAYVEKPVQAANNEYTTDPDVDGTSFSGPIVAGVVGLVMSKFPALSPDAVKKRILDACDPVAGHLFGDPLYHGIVNAEAALTAPVTPALAIQSFTVNGSPDGKLLGVGSSNSLDVTFVNTSSSLATNLHGIIVDGAGYTGDGISRPIASLSELGISPAVIFPITRTGQFSEGSIPVKIAVYDATSYHDTLIVQLQLSKVPGMTHRLLVQHGTCVKEVDGDNGWAGFGYHLFVHDVEKDQDTNIIISQYSKRTNHGWSAPIDFGGQDTITTVDAIDANTAWFGGTDVDGNNVIHYTTDGGNTEPWPTTTDPGMTVKALHFSDGQHGTIIGDASSGRWQIKTTADGGASWQTNNPNATNPAEKTFYNDATWVGTHGWFGTDNGEIVTNYQGNQWKTFSVAGTKLKNVTSIAMSFETAQPKYGYAAVHGPTGDSLYYTQTAGLSWSPYKKGAPGFNVYGITFIPGSDTAVITSQQGIFLLAKPDDALQPLPAPASWDTHASFISAGGVPGNYTIAGNSDRSGVADFSVGATLLAVEAPTEAPQLEMITAPNPFTSSTMLYFSMPKTEIGHIYLADVLGRTATEVFSGSLTEGPHAIAVNAIDLPNGVYHCVLETESGVRAERSIVLSH
jgi:subtilisin family serine protease